MKHCNLLNGTAQRSLPFLNISVHFCTFLCISFFFRNPAERQPCHHHRVQVHLYQGLLLPALRLPRAGVRQRVLLESCQCVHNDLNARVHVR